MKQLLNKSRRCLNNERLYRYYLFTSHYWENENVYTFKVAKSATKTQIKKAIENAFGVTVKSVNTLNTKPKKRRVGRYTGMTKTYKKAIVTLDKDSKIEL